MSYERFATRQNLVAVKFACFLFLSHAFNLTDYLTRPNMNFACVAYKRRTEEQINTDAYFVPCFFPVVILRA